MYKRTVTIATGHTDRRHPDIWEHSHQTLAQSRKTAGILRKIRSPCNLSSIMKILHMRTAVYRDKISRSVLVGGLLSLRWKLSCSQARRRLRIEAAMALATNEMKKFFKVPLYVFLLFKQ